ncbi:uncharacterized protein KD926_004464 [Aspergillus affinis]|uniref:uncharacterized protein n=1 Tax=Aspergillus affinis TaxID=1070780 RepID=UPI0022FF29E2|nr:uncharacterized protein KD926_004464 [Aspergillus affinis]KAI9035148.1 hypothetical protein KD926_004464 [Aspergillus affinis]
MPKLLATLAASSLFYLVFTIPTGDVEQWKSHPVEYDPGNSIYKVQPSCGKRVITVPSTGSHEQPYFGASVGNRAILESALQLNATKPDDMEDLSVADGEDLTTVLQALDLTSHGHGLVSRGEKEEKEFNFQLWNGQTYYDFIEATEMDPETKVTKKKAKMHPNEIRELAKIGYDRIKSKHEFKGNVIVSALFIPNLGIAVDSKPRGTGVAAILLDTTHKIKGKKVYVEHWFQRYWDFIETRDIMNSAKDSTPREDLLHAEDLVIIKGADKFLTNQKILDWGLNLKFPKGTHMVSYGKYNSEPGSSSVGPKEPCGGTERTKLTISCKDVLSYMGIDWSI